jgi:hypothetical protein
VCPDSHPILAVDGISKRFRFRLTSLSKSFASAVEASQPQIVIPCDDISLTELRRLGEDPGAELAALSLAAQAKTFETLLSRAGFMEAAAAMGLPCPPSQPVADRRAVERWLEMHGAPAFLKVEQSFGGSGVRAVWEPRAAGDVFASLARPPNPMDATRHFVKWQDPSKLNAWFRRTPSQVCIQAGVAGGPANCSAFAWRGEVRAIVCVEAVRTLGEFGVATVVRAVENPEMEAAARTLAERLQLTGLFGLDFVVDKEAGRTWLIELNARPTPISHMAFGPGRDPVAAILSAVSGAPPVVRPATPMGAAIALFPHCLRPGAAPDRAVLDLPTDQPRLVRTFAPSYRRPVAAHAPAAFAAVEKAQPVRV